EERRQAATEIASEGSVDVRGYAAGNQGTRHVRSSDRRVSRLAQDVGERDLHTKPLQPGDHLLRPAVPGGARPDEKLLQPRLARGQEVPEQVQLAPRRFDAELATRNDPDRECLSRARGLLYAVRSVVVGQGDRGEARGLGPSHHFGGGVLPVGCGRMTMEINARRRRSPETSRQAVTGATARSARGPTARRARRR